MTVTDIYHNGKNLLTCELQKLSTDRSKAALAETAAKDKREIAADLTQTARNMREQAKPYLERGAQHRKQSDDAIWGVVPWGATSLDSRVCAVAEHQVKNIHNLRLAEPFTSAASACESVAAELSRGARKDEFMVIVHKVKGAVKLLLHIN